ncbi:hypothetical protein [Azobacteroides phage ProJPt-Bp1]|uniref:Uncharacterized protein n=1 Tax=Azobacteroides phage ProJPt-Bp1 TaxID=1920526 RepID=A0A1V1FPN6_9CAUD|nr:hypothetical protein KNT10_gp41 [Azobacteroides phage ProJPt-Bp1]BAX03422.1 hypothetical protein [Azobacteroides phage ProJPt-Bp1]
MASELLLKDGYITAAQHSSKTRPTLSVATMKDLQEIDWFVEKEVEVVESTKTSTRKVVNTSSLDYVSMSNVEVDPGTLNQGTQVAAYGDSIEFNVEDFLSSVGTHLIIDKQGAVIDRAFMSTFMTSTSTPAANEFITKAYADATYIDTVGMTEVKHDSTLFGKGTTDDELKVVTGQLAKATESSLGIVQPDNATIIINDQGIMSAVGDGTGMTSVAHGDTLLGAGTAESKLDVAMDEIADLLLEDEAFMEAVGADIPVATTTTAGIVMPDGETISVDDEGVISVVPGLEKVEHDSTLTGDGTVGNELSVVDQGYIKKVEVNPLSPLTGDGTTATPLSLDLTPYVKKTGTAVSIEATDTLYEYTFAMDGQGISLTAIEDESAMALSSTGLEVVAPDFTWTRPTQWASSMNSVVLVSDLMQYLLKSEHGTTSDMDITSSPTQFLVKRQDYALIPPISYSYESIELGTEVEGVRLTAESAEGDKSFIAVKPTFATVNSDSFTWSRGSGYSAGPATVAIMSDIPTDYVKKSMSSGTVSTNVTQDDGEFIYNTSNSTGNNTHIEFELKANASGYLKAWLEGVAPVNMGINAQLYGGAVSFGMTDTSVMFSKDYGVEISRKSGEDRVEMTIGDDAVITRAANVAANRDSTSIATLADIPNDRLLIGSTKVFSATHAACDFEVWQSGNVRNYVFSPKTITSAYVNIATLPGALIPAYNLISAMPWNAENTNAQFVGWCSISGGAINYRAAFASVNVGFRVTLTYIIPDSDPLQQYTQKLSFSTQKVFEFSNSDVNAKIVRNGAIVDYMIQTKVGKGGWTNITTIPEALRPTEPQIWPTILNAASTFNLTCGHRIGTNGQWSYITEHSVVAGEWQHGFYLDPNFDGAYVVEKETWHKYMEVTMRSYYNGGTPYSLTFPNGWVAPSAEYAVTVCNGPNTTTESVNLTLKTRSTTGFTYILNNITQVDKGSQTYYIGLIGKY